MPPAATHIPSAPEPREHGRALSLLRKAATALDAGDRDSATLLTREASALLAVKDETRVSDADTPRSAILHLLPLAWRAAPLSCRLGGYLRLAATMACIAITLTALAIGHRVEEWFSPAGVTVTYYRGTQFEHRICRRSAPELSADYDGRRPAFRVPAEGFSARWSGWLVAPTNDTYTFFAQSMDGIRVRIDGAAVLDRWVDQEWETSRQRWDRQLTEGPHRIEVEHYSREGHAAFMIRWTGGGIDKPTVLSAPYLRKRLEEPVQ